MLENCHIRLARVTSLATMASATYALRHALSFFTLIARQKSLLGLARSKRKYSPVRSRRAARAPLASICRARAPPEAVCNCGRCSGPRVPLGSWRLLRRIGFGSLISIARDRWRGTGTPTRRIRPLLRGCATESAVRGGRAGFTRYGIADQAGLRDSSDSG